MSAGNTYPFGWVSGLYGAGIGNATSIQDAPVEPAPTNDDILQYNAGNNTWENKNIGEIIGITGSDNQVMRYDADTGFIQNSNLIITDTDNLTGVNTLQVNELDGPAAGITTTADIDAGSNKVKSTAVPAANDELTNKLYVDGLVGNKVDGPASADANRICVFDGTTGKLIKQEGFGINSGILNAYDGVGNPTTILFGNDLSMLNNDITQVNEINVDTISSNAGGVVEFTDRPTTTNTPLNASDLTNKLYVDGEVADKVVGPASAAANRICVFNGTTGKLIKQEEFGINSGILNAYDGVGNPTPIQFGDDLNMLNNDISAVGDLGVDSITANTGSVITFNNKPQSSTAPTVDNDLTNRLYVEQRLGYFYAMLADGPTVQVSGGTPDPESSLLPSGVGDFTGTLTVPANGFSVGDSFHFVLAGVCEYDTSNVITLRLKNGGELASLTMDLENTDNPNVYWELEADFSIRSIGSLGSICTNFDFTFNKRVDKDFKGQRNVSVSTIDTTVSNTLDITCEFTGTADSNMFAQLGYLKKMH